MDEFIEHVTLGYDSVTHLENKVLVAYVFIHIVGICFLTKSPIIPVHHDTCTKVA